MNDLIKEDLVNLKNRYKIIFSTILVVVLIAVLDIYIKVDAGSFFSYFTWITSLVGEHIIEIVAFLFTIVIGDNILKSIKRQDTENKVFKENSAYEIMNSRVISTVISRYNCNNTNIFSIYID